MPRCLLIPQVGFLPPDDPRVHGTVAAIERELMVDGLVLRYRTEENVDGLPPGEGAFLACSFWLADALCSTATPTPSRCSSASVVSQRPRPASRGIRPARAASSSAISRRASPTSP